MWYATLTFFKKQQQEMSQHMSNAPKEIRIAWDTFKESYL